MNHDLRRALFVLPCALVLVLGVGYLLALALFGRTQLPSATTLLDIGAGVVCLCWLLLILRVPWDIYFAARDVLFEMERSRERGLAVNTERARYVTRLRRRAGLLAIGAHFGSAALIVALTYWARGQIGYYFAFFYVVTTFIRPASRAYHYLLAQLREIRGEIRFPRDDVVKLRAEVADVVEQVRGLQTTRLRALEESLGRAAVRTGAGEEAHGRLRAEVYDLRAVLEAAERSFQERLRTLTTEVEQTLARAFDNQNIVNGLSAFARLIKQA